MNNNTIIFWIKSKFYIARSFGNLKYIKIMQYIREYARGILNTEKSKDSKTKQLTQVVCGHRLNGRVMQVDHVK